MDEIVNTFLADISDKAPAENKKRDRRSRKRGIMDVENDFLTVGGGQIVTETDDPDDNRQEASFGHHEEHWDSSGREQRPPVQRADKPRDDRQGAPKEKQGQNPNNTKKNDNIPKPRENAEPKSGGRNQNNANKGNASESEVLKKLENIIKGQTHIMEDLDLLKNLADTTAFRQEVTEKLNKLSSGTGTPSPAPVKKADATPADIPPLLDDDFKMLDMSSKLEPASSAAEGTETGTDREFAEKAKTTIERLAQQLSEKEAENNELKEKNEKLKAENIKMRNAIMQKIQAEKAAFASMGAPQPAPSPAPAFQPQQSPASVQAAPPVAQRYQPQAIQPTVLLQQDQIPVMPQQMPASPVSPQGQFMPQAAPPMQANTPSQSANSVWGNEAPPAVDLLADEEPKKKRGLFGRKKK